MEKNRAEQERKEQKENQDVAGQDRPTKAIFFPPVTTHHPQQSTFASPDFSRTLAVRPLKPEAQKRTEAKSGKKKKRGR